MRYMHINLLAFVLLFIVSCSKEESRTWYWCDLREQGDTCIISFQISINKGMEIRNDIVSNYDPLHTFFGYDTSVVQVNKMSIFPKNIGSTVIYVRHPNPDSSRIVDSFHVTVQNVGGRLQVKKYRLPNQALKPTE